jgi:hypothetical protein
MDQVFFNRNKGRLKRVLGDINRELVFSAQVGNAENGDRHVRVIQRLLLHATSTDPVSSFSSRFPGRKFPHQSKRPHCYYRCNNNLPLLPELSELMNKDMGYENSINPGSYLFKVRHWIKCLYITCTNGKLCAFGRMVSLPVPEISLIFKVINPHYEKLMCVPAQCRAQLSYF